MGPRDLHAAIASATCAWVMRMIKWPREHDQMPKVELCSRATALVRYYSVKAHAITSKPKTSMVPRQRQIRVERHHRCLLEKRLESKVYTV